MWRDDAILIDMEAALRLAIEFSQGQNEASFRENRLLQAAILHELMILGEAVNGLSNEFRATHTGIPWRDITNLRHRIVHDYAHMDLGKVWNIVEHEVPALLLSIEPLLPKEPV